MTQQLARIIEMDRRDTKERVIALRLQAFAWRLVAVIGTAKPAYAKSKIKWLMLVSFPNVDGAALEKFIAEHEAMARECGIKSRVFAS